MKKAFDANVSRSKPRVRLGAMLGGGEHLSAVEHDGGSAHDSMTTATVEAIAEQVARTDSVIPSVEQPVDLSAALKSRQLARASKYSAAEALNQALETPVAHESAPVARTVVVTQTQAPVAAPAPIVAHAEAPPSITEVQTAPAPRPDVEPGDRRERLKERLRAVRENPRPEPLPETVAEAGVLAVERISALQSELTKSRALNLALAQDLEAARRQAERATEEARLRMDEARRLSSEMEGRVKLLSDLERELESLESERNEALLALQESRQALDAREGEKASLAGEIAKRDAEINECLVEEERLAGELEAAQETVGSLRRASDALKTERDTLARQVSDLTRERTELLEARKALEAVHRALSHAVSK